MMHWIMANLPYVSAVVSAFLTGFFGWLRSLYKEWKLSKRQEESSYIERQKQLVDEQKKFLEEQNAFRQEMREEIRRLKEQLLIEQKRNSRLEEELAMYKKNYAELELQNRKLQIRVHELETILNIRESINKIQEGDDNGNDQNLH